MRPRYRSLTPPLIAILVLSAGMTGCETQASRERARLAAEAARRQAETEPPTEEVLSQIRQASEIFMHEHHANEKIESCSFTSLTPNLFLVGVSVQGAASAGSVRQLSAERIRDEEKSWFTGDLKENGDLLWVIDDLDEVKMAILARRHGLAGEVAAIDAQDPGYTQVHSWGHRTWLDDYLLWHYLYHRPAPVLYTLSRGYQTQAEGFRFQDPQGAMIQPEDARPYQASAARTGGRSSVFLGGSAWRPPLASQVGVTHGSVFLSKGFGVSHGFSRGGFGGAGHAAGGHGG
jgi:hypothetical protein